MKRRYVNCIRQDGLCGICYKRNGEVDCEGKKINRLLFYRSTIETTQQELANKTGINIRQIQKYESGEYDLGNITLRNACKLQEVLYIDDLRKLCPDYDIFGQLISEYEVTSKKSE